MAVAWLSVGGQGVGAAQAPAPAPAASADQAQIDKGRQAVGQACLGCHANILRVVQMHRKSADDWRDTVYSMIGRGAQILPEEIEPITAFLAATAGPNRAAAPAQPAGAARASSDPASAEAQGILQRQCTRCHDLATATKKPAAGDVKTVLARMVGYGAQIGSEDQQKLIAYLPTVHK
jgi:cytochrome c2